MLAGIDEAGRGAWAGPVVAAAVILDYTRIPEGITDSKQLPSEKREIIYGCLRACAKIGVGIVEVGDIARLNILRATLLAMERAYEALGVSAEAALIDGTMPPRLPCAVRTVVKGDNICLSVAAASIVAKVTRDRLMVDLHGKYPAYGWNRNMGYGTQAHQRALEQHGATPYHREGYSPVAALRQECLNV